MIRKIITIDSDKCNGCGLCAQACHEGAIRMQDGKAVLIRDDYCDGLGDCLPVCPTNAISFEEREALPYDAEAVAANQRAKQPLPCGCPSTASKRLNTHAEQPQFEAQRSKSQLQQWPLQIKLVPVNATYFEGANLLVAADCTAFAYGSFHQDFIKNHITLIGCPKLDEGDYTQKLTAILTQNNIKSLKIVRMEVPCCGGIVSAAQTALKNSGKFIAWQVVTISVDGKILD